MNWSSSLTPLEWDKISANTAVAAKAMIGMHASRPD
jgi:hypothetical protein